MPGTIAYDDTNLQKLYAEMDPKKRMKALKGAFRKEASKVRKVAIRNLRESLRSNKDLERGIRAEVFKKIAGFRVTIGSKVMKGRYKGKRNGVRRYGRAKSTWTNFSYHTNRQGKEKPVLIWAEGGTQRRESKKATKYALRSDKWGTGRKRGYMKRYGFMEKTADEVRGRVTNDLHEEMIESVKKVANKYGCI